MSRLLIIKTSSLGDVVHNLPIVADILKAAPDTTVDWVVEEAYSDLPRLHPGVRRVIAVAQRRWRRSLSETVAREKEAFEALLQEEAYDLVLDTQGLLKSALLARMARLAPGGERVGFSRRWAREGLARLFYDRGYDVQSHLHAVERIRSLAAQALGYQPEGNPRFGLQVEPARFDWLASGPYCVLLHATSRPEKVWPGEAWKILIRAFANEGVTSVLPFGSERERSDAEELAANEPGAIVAPKLALSSVAGLLAGARVVVGVDTGLTHLAAALEVPTVALFGATPRWRYAPYWTPKAVSLGEHGRQPSATETLAALHGLGVLGRV
jgi:heptosyltransferase-1